jgi:hypothetical protein
MSNAMLFPAVTEFSLGAAPSRYADCARAMGVAADGLECFTSTLETINDRKNANDMTASFFDSGSCVESGCACGYHVLDDGDPVTRRKGSFDSFSGPMGLGLLTHGEGAQWPWR